MVIFQLSGLYCQLESCSARLGLAVWLPLSRLTTLGPWIGPFFFEIFLQYMYAMLMYASAPGNLRALRPLVGKKEGREVPRFLEELHWETTAALYGLAELLDSDSMQAPQGCAGGLS